MQFLVLFPCYVAIFVHPGWIHQHNLEKRVFFSIKLIQNSYNVIFFSSGRNKMCYHFQDVATAFKLIACFFTPEEKTEISFKKLCTFLIFCCFEESFTFIYASHQFLLYFNISVTFKKKTINTLNVTFIKCAISDNIQFAFSK